MHHAPEQQFRLGGLPDSRERGTERVRRGAGVQGRPSAHASPLGGQLAAARVVARVVPTPVSPALERVRAQRESAPQASQPAKVRHPHRQLEHDQRMGTQVLLLVRSQRLGVVPERAPVGGRVPRPIATAVVQRARAGVGDAAYAPRAGIDEVALEPRLEVRRRLAPYRDSQAPRAGGGSRRHPAGQCGLSRHRGRYGR